MLRKGTFYDSDCNGFCSGERAWRTDSVVSRVETWDLLWKRICETDSAAGAVMVFSAPNEQGFEMKVSGDPKRKVNDFEGIQLITVSEEVYRNTEAEECFEFPFELQLLEEEDR